MSEDKKNMSSQEVFDPTKYDVAETQSQKFARKYQEAPFMVFGLAGCALAVAYGAYMYRHRGKMSTSIYLMQLRVAAQGTVVGAVTLGVGYSLLKRLFPSDNGPKNE